MPKVLPEWPWPAFQSISDPSKLQSDLQKLVTIMQYFATAVATRVNYELLTNVAQETATENGTLDFGSSGALELPVYAGDPASPGSAQVWLNTVLHRFRGNTDNNLLYSFGFFRSLQFSVAVAGGANTLTQALSPHEPDTNFLILVEPAWTTAWSVSAKSVSSFSLAFVTAAPGGGSTISYGLIR